MKGKSLSRVLLLATPWTAAYQAPPSMGFSRQEYWSGVPLPSPHKCTKTFKMVHIKKTLKKRERASRQSTALTYQFQPSDTDSGFVACATVRKEVSVILSHLVYGNYLQQPQKTDTFPYSLSLSHSFKQKCHAKSLQSCLTLRPHGL